MERLKLWWDDNKLEVVLIAIWIAAVVAIVLLVTV